MFEGEDSETDNEDDDSRCNWVGDADRAGDGIEMESLLGSIGVSTCWSWKRNVG